MLLFFYFMYSGHYNRADLSTGEQPKIELEPLDNLTVPKYYLDEETLIARQQLLWSSTHKAMKGVAIVAEFEAKKLAEATIANDTYLIELLLQSRVSLENTQSDLLKLREQVFAAQFSYKLPNGEFNFAALQLLQSKDFKDVGNANYLSALCVLTGKDYRLPNISRNSEYIKLLESLNLEDRFTEDNRIYQSPLKQNDNLEIQTELSRRVNKWFNEVPKYLANSFKSAVAKIDYTSLDRFVSTAKVACKTQRLIKFKDISHGIQMGIGLEILEFAGHVSLIPVLGKVGAAATVTLAELGLVYLSAGKSGVSRTLAQGCACPEHLNQQETTENNNTNRNIFSRVSKNCRDRVKDLVDAKKSLFQGIKQRFIELDQTYKYGGIEKAIKFVAVRGVKDINYIGLQAIDTGWRCAGFVAHKLVDYGSIKLGLSYGGLVGAATVSAISSFFVHIPLSIIQRIGDESDAHYAEIDRRKIMFAQSQLSNFKL
jgi:hypothetical protein